MILFLCTVSGCTIRWVSSISRRRSLPAAAGRGGRVPGRGPGAPPGYRGQHPGGLPDQRDLRCPGGGRPSPRLPPLPKNLCDFALQGLHQPNKVSNKENLRFFCPMFFLSMGLFSQGKLIVIVAFLSQTSPQRKVTFFNIFLVWLKSAILASPEVGHKPPPKEFPCADTKLQLQPSHSCTGDCTSSTDIDGCPECRWNSPPPRNGGGGVPLQAATGRCRPLPPPPPAPRPAPQLEAPA